MFMYLLISFVGLSRIIEYLSCVYAAVLFLEFWKRRQFQLQYDWDMLGYEDAEVNQTHVVHVQFCFAFFLSML